VDPEGRNRTCGERLGRGEKLDAKITAIDAKTRRITLSIKQREAEEEKKAMKDYGSAESGASLGDDMLNTIVTADGLVAVVCAFQDASGVEPDPVGDFEAVREIASKYLGSLPLIQHVGTVDRSKILTFPEHQSFQISVSTQIPKSLVVIAYPSEDLWDIQRTRRLNVLADVVSERLRVKIREKLGASYSPFAFNRSSRAYPGYGVFHIYIHVDPQKADMVVVEVNKLTSNLVRSGVTEEEMKRALDPTLTSIKDMRRRNGYWLSTVLSGSRNHPVQYNWSRTIMKDYASIKVDELDRIAKKYLNNKKAVTIIVKPAINSD